MYQSWKIVRLSVVVCCVGLGGYEVFADQDTSPQEPGQHRLQRFEQTLDLTEAERSQVQQITQDYQTRRKQLTDQLDALRQEEDGKLRAILTPEQQARFDQMQQRRTEHRQDKGQDESQNQWQGAGRRHARHGGPDRWGSQHRGSWSD